MAAINCCITFHDALDELMWVMDTFTNVHVDETFAVKAGQVDLSVCCDDNALCFLNFLGSKDILSTYATLSFNLY